MATTTRASSTSAHSAPAPYRYRRRPPARRGRWDDIGVLEPRQQRRAAPAADDRELLPWVLVLTASTLLMFGVAAGHTAWSLSAAAAAGASWWLGTSIARRRRVWRPTHVLWVEEADEMVRRHPHRVEEIHRCLWAAARRPDDYTFDVSRTPTDREALTAASHREVWLAQCAWRALADDLLTASST